MMAVFVASYVTRGERERIVAHAYIGYIGHCAGRDKKPTHRALWGEDGQLSYDKAVAIVESAKAGSWFYRLSIDPSPATEDIRRDLHLKTLTAKTLTQIQQQMATDVPWVAAIHDDHSDKRHIHVLAVTPRRMNRADLEAVRLAATDECRGQRRQFDASRSLTHERDREHDQSGRQHSAQDRGRERVLQLEQGRSDQGEEWDE